MKFVVVLPPEYSALLNTFKIIHSKTKLSLFSVTDYSVLLRMFYDHLEYMSIILKM